MTYCLPYDVRHLTHILVFLTDHVRSPSTYKVFLGGGSLLSLLHPTLNCLIATHDNGYVPDLRSHIAHGQSEKLVLLPGYSETALGIKQLGFPSLVVPDLFLEEKINLWGPSRTFPARANSVDAYPTPKSTPSRLGTRRSSDAGFFTPATHPRSRTPARSRSRAASVRRPTTSSVSESSEESLSTPDSSPSQGTISLASDTDNVKNPPLNVVSESDVAYQTFNKTDLPYLKPLNKREFR